MSEKNSLKIIKEKHHGIEIAALSEIGDRKEQQDALSFLFENDKTLIVVCDGMGGHNGGRIASSIAAEGFIYDCKHMFNEIECDYQSSLIACAKKIDRTIFSLTDESGNKLNAGSTAVAIVLASKRLFWCSCGDSRAYLLRNREFVQFTKDQNYRTVLQEQLNAGIISKEDYLKQVIGGDALVSYLGIGDLSLVDYNESPLLLYCGDRIIITTDGLYKLLSDADIKRILIHSITAEDAVTELWFTALKEAEELNIAMDNITIVIIEIR